MNNRVIVLNRSDRVSIRRRTRERAPSPESIVDHSIETPTQQNTVSIEPIDFSTEYNGPNSINTDNIQDKCFICLDNINSSEVYKIPECNHSLHSKCAANWFRTSRDSRCPFCRTVIDRDSSNYYYGYGNGKYKFVRNFAKRQSAPKSLKTLVNKLKRLETNMAVTRNSYKEWRKTVEYKEYMRCRNLHSEYRNYKQRRQMYRLKKEIAEYPILPIIIKINKK